MDSLLRGNALFALAAAALWGGGDFSGGMGVKSAGGGVRAALRVVLLSHITSFAVLVAIARLRGDVFPHGALLAWGMAAGVAGGLALTAFYIALSRGAMGASAAVSGLLAAAIPAALTLWQQGSPGALPLLGFAVAGAAIWLIAAGPARGAESWRRPRSTVVLAMLAGVGFGLYFVALKMAGSAGIVWPMATARIGSLTVCSAMLLGLRLQPGERSARAVQAARPWAGRCRRHCWILPAICCFWRRRVQAGWTWRRCWRRCIRLRRFCWRRWRWASGLRGGRRWEC